MLVTATLAAITVNSTSVTIFTQQKKCSLVAGGLLLPADQGPNFFHFVALPSPKDSKSFVSGRWKQRRLCSEMAHITISYIHLGKNESSRPHLGARAAGLRTLWLDRPLSVTVPQWGGQGGQRMSWWT